MVAGVPAGCAGGDGRVGPEIRGLLAGQDRGGDDTCAGRKVAAQPTVPAGHDVRRCPSRGAGVVPGRRATGLVGHRPRPGRPSPQRLRHGRGRERLPCGSRPPDRPADHSPDRPADPPADWQGREEPDAGRAYRSMTVRGRLGKSSSVRPVAAGKAVGRDGSMRYLLKMLTPPGPISRPTTISTMPISSPPRMIVTMPAMTSTTAMSHRMVVMVPPSDKDCARAPTPQTSARRREG